MKRHYARVAAGCLILAGIVAACNDTPVQVEADSPVNPYRTSAHELLDGLIDHAITATESYSGGYKDPGLVLLDAMGSFEGLGVDIQVDEVNRQLLAMQNLRVSGKRPSRAPLADDPTLNEGQKKWLHRALDRAEAVVDVRDLDRVLAEVDRQAVGDLGTEDVRVVHHLTATLYASYVFFNDPTNMPRIGRLVRALERVAGPARETGPRFLKIQAALTPRPPPTFGEFFNPADWWQATLGDARTGGQIGVLVGAGAGCSAGLLTLGPPGCVPGAGIGTPIGGALGVVGGGLIGGVVNYIGAVHDYNQAESAWCGDQRRLNPVLRNDSYSRLCGPTQQ